MAPYNHPRCALNDRLAAISDYNHAETEFMSNPTQSQVAIVVGGLVLLGSVLFMANYRIVPNERYDDLIARAAGAPGAKAGDPATTIPPATSPPATPPPAAPSPPPQGGPPPAQGGYPTGALVGSKHVLDYTGSASKGPSSAPVTVAVFSDFQCPACSQWIEPIQSTMATYGNKIRFVFKHLPLPMHNNARKAALASEAANNQGKFWPMHDLLFQNQNALSRADLERYAGQLGLDLGKFKKDFDDPETRKRVDRDFQEANRIGVPGTPTFFIDGMRADIAAPHQLDALIGNAVTKAKP